MHVYRVIFGGGSEPISSVPTRVPGSSFDDLRLVIGRFSSRVTLSVRRGGSRIAINIITDVPKVVEAIEVVRCCCRAIR